MLGYLLRLLANIANLPRITDNLRQHYAHYGAEARRLNAIVLDLEHHMALEREEAARRIALLEERLLRLEAEAELSKGQR